MVLYGGGKHTLFPFAVLFVRPSSLTISLAIFGPAATTWYSFLQRNIVLKSSAATTVARVVADQTIFTPVHLFCFLSSMSIMEGNDPVEKLQTTFLPTYKANLTLWPAVQLANFSLVPLEHRVLVVNLVSLGKLAVQQHERGLLTWLFCRLELLLELGQQQGMNTFWRSALSIFVFEFSIT
jgi:hypothetical protein